MFSRKLLTLVGALGFVLSLGACQSKKSGGDKQAESESPKQEQQKQDEGGDKKGDEGSAQKGDKGESPEKTTVTLKPEGNKMQFQEDGFTVKAGQKVKLVFNNTATSKAMKHNVLMLNTNDDKVAAEVAKKGTKAKDNGYVPEHDAIMANTSLSEPGEKVEVTFTAPEEPGKYKYICTYPAHYQAGMVGVMTVEK